MAKFFREVLSVNSRTVEEYKEVLDENKEDKKLEGKMEGKM